MIYKRAFIKATEDIKAQYHVHQNKSQQQLDIQDEIDKTIKLFFSRAFIFLAFSQMILSNFVGICNVNLESISFV